MRLVPAEQTVSGCDPDGDDDRVAQEHRLTIWLDDFAWEAITLEAQQAGVSIEEMAKVSILYYLADLDSGRISRRLPPTLVV